MGRIPQNRSTLARCITASLATATMALAFTGCSTAAPKAQSVSTLQRTPTAQFKVPPKDMVKRIEQAVAAAPLSLTIASDQHGTIETGWKEYPGELHIVRRWYERTRFQIVVTPDFDEPTSSSRVQVFDETEERSIESHPWFPTEGAQRPERSAEVLAAIKASVGS